MAIIKAAQSGASLRRIIHYVTQEKKTEEPLLAGIHCDPQNAYDDMMLIKTLFRKKGGRQYKHFIYSYPPGESITPQQVLENAQCLVAETPALKGYQALIAVHKDRKHIHAHIIVNSVHSETGYKLQWSKMDLADLKERCNTLSRAQGMSVPEKSPDITTWTMPKQQVLSKALQGQYKSYYLAMADAISACQLHAVSRDDFVCQMAEKGIQVHWTDKRKHITFIDGDDHKVRDSNFEKTLKIACSKAALEAQFAKNAARALSVAQIKTANRPKTNDSLWANITGIIKGKLTSWKEHRQEERSREALQFAASISECSKMKEPHHAVSAEYPVGRATEGPRGNPASTGKNRNAATRNRTFEGQEPAGQERKRPSQLSDVSHQRKPSITKKRIKTERKRSQGLER